MRASHADRERAIDVLKAGFSEGRLGQAEYEQRLTRATHAQTYAELNVLLADLPQGPVPMPPAQQAPPAYQPVPRTFLPTPPPKTNGTAVGALICGILTPMYGITAIPAVILGHVAKSQIRRSGEDGAGFATAGLVLGWLAIGAVLAFILAVVVASS
ncbi:DUF1707 and DUF4190 domain-containing protein [Streptomyces albus subsp. chlorinus]|uniref:DUF1707 and DUF4190 domain-containing protein n=1 Tax=Streptomyces albus TaxID=1888 RepID=UPI00156F3529|nr:DUF1707 and DUF4190 domain-containing protein [Streptomyces albus]NSC23336.1 DUF1707 and DUF4190 domain-containing protein [Streptomyces albus subsp. chlorinus]